MQNFVYYSMGHMWFQYWYIVENVVWNLFNFDILNQCRKATCQMQY
jgi:hypothetical protein